LILTPTTSSDDCRLDVPAAAAAAAAAAPSERVFVGRHAAAGTAGPVDPLDDMRLLEAGSRTAPDSVALRKVFWRSVRTVGPLVVSDLLALSLVGLFARAALALEYPPAAPFAAWVGVLALLPLIFAYWVNGLYSEVWAHPVVEFRQLTHISTIGLLAAAAGGAAAWPLPLWCAAAWPAAVTLVPLFRNAIHRCCEGRPWWGYPTLVIGSGDGTGAAARVLLDVPRSGLRPVLLTDVYGRCPASNLPVVNDRATLESILRTRVIRHAVVSLPDLPTARLVEVLDRFGGLLPHVLVLSDSATLPTLWGASRSSGRLSGLEVRNALLLDTLQCVKRLVDVTVALLALGVGLPVLVVVAALVKLTSPGPVLYGHTRIGRCGRPFKAWKFRTMRTVGDAVLRQHLARDAVARAEWERDQKLRDDPRVTAVGRLLRELSLDELPQLWNVLRGDMSLVGPRPIVQAEAWRYGDGIRLYAKVKPGITGLWQVSGRNRTSYDDRVQLDLFYVRHWSPWFDVYILAKTVVTLISREGAY
jgi:Undecaprenyl-phosphate galactose phosphotransferase WbaP